MPDKIQQDTQPERMLFIDEAAFLLSGQSAAHPKMLARSAIREDTVSYLVDMLHVFAGGKLTADQRAEVVAVVLSLQTNETTMERIVMECAGKPSLASFSAALQKRLAASTDL